MYLIYNSKEPFICVRIVLDSHNRICSGSRKGDPCVFSVRLSKHVDKPCVQVRHGLPVPSHRDASGDGNCKEFSWEITSVLS